LRPTHSQEAGKAGRVAREGDQNVIHEKRDDRIGANRLADPDRQGEPACDAGLIAIKASPILATLSFSRLK
jgi:hypothetical protein